MEERRVKANSRQHL